MHIKQLFTIGYEGSDLVDFLATLSACGVEQVIDIRDVPISRKRGFSKNALAEVLASRGIAYLHLKGLGDPKPGRDAARRGDFSAFRKIYAQHLKGHDAQAGLRMAAQAAGAKLSCLLCFERAHEHCHRTIVAAALSDQERFTIKHLGVRKNLASDSRPIHERDRNRELALG